MMTTMRWRRRRGPPEGKPPPTTPTTPCILHTSSPPPPPPMFKPTGTGATISLEIALAILRTPLTTPARVLAAQYGVATETIRKYRRGETDLARQALALLGEDGGRVQRPDASPLVEEIAAASPLSEEQERELREMEAALRQSGEAGEG